MCLHTSDSILISPLSKYPTDFLSFLSRVHRRGLLLVMCFFVNTSSYRALRMM
jgi:hypothetical protein